MIRPPTSDPHASPPTPMDDNPWAAHWVLSLRIALAREPNSLLREEMGHASEDESLTTKMTALEPSIAARNHRFVESSNRVFDGASSDPRRK